MLAFPLLQNLKGIPVIKEFVNGLFPVHTFILLAGFSLCCSLQNKDPQRSIATLVAKRYFRFVVPLVIPTLLAFVLAHPTKSVAGLNQTPTILDRKRTECPLPHAVGF